MMANEIQNISCSRIKYILLVTTLLSCAVAFSQKNIRTETLLKTGWRTIADDRNKNAWNGFEFLTFNDAKWKHVDVPHNWDAYEGYRRMRHGNRHGYAWYRKLFSLQLKEAGKKYFLFFEGVGSYATVYLNGKKVGYHEGGRTTFTLDVTHAIREKNNLLAVRADHPANINDLPWVCGGCSDERGFSEGSQPMGIFRPVHLIVTNEVRVEPFGIHIWNGNNVSENPAQLFIETEIKNYSNGSKNISIVNRLIDKNGSTVFQVSSGKKIHAGTAVVLKQVPPIIPDPHFWNLQDPYLYKLVSQVIENGKIIDETNTVYGIRWISWPIGKTSSKQFLLNGKPVFINGIAEYEHLLGNSHAFSDEEVRARVMQIKAAGFNAFRDAHQPHNLLYQKYWDELGILEWTQMSAHIWFDSPAFRKNFKILLQDWVKERRNSPSVILWGLQNESKLPGDFAKECTELIRQLDPTTSSQRLVTTCNGGSGTDWDVPQNWTGTYGGDPETYATDIKKQILVGEYGAWRTLDLHTEGPFTQNGPVSEDRMTGLMEKKVKLAEAVKDSTAGHFMWLLTSHDNPGRVQGGEGYRELDRIGPVNYKGLLTPWEEPLDVYYMYRSNYAPKEKDPMVYIVSHTWPDRWITTGKKDGIVVYSNCDEVELFNDIRSSSLGRKRRQGPGTHFQWDGVDINYNVLYAVGYVNGKEVARDEIVLHHLPQSPNFNLFYKDAKPLTAPQPGYHYIYRVNCGGPEYVDENKNIWLADRALEPGLKTTNYRLQTSWGSTSWTNDFPGMPSFFASQRRTNDPVAGTKDWKLFQTFRYGREKLRYYFPLPDGEYLVELYFTEPWFGTGGGADCTGWRLFDVAVNDKTVLKDVDIWKEVGHNAALKKTITVKISGGLLTVSFPKIASGQAVISAIAIASTDKKIKASPPPRPLIQNVSEPHSQWSSWVIQQWADNGDRQFKDLPVYFRSLPPALYGAEWLQTSGQAAKISGNAKGHFTVSKEADIYLAYEKKLSRPQWLNDFIDTKEIIENSEGKLFAVYKKRFSKNDTVHIEQNQSDMYSVFAVPVTTMEPAYDLKPVISYKAVNAHLYGSVATGMVDGKPRVIFNKASVKNAVEWDISIGAADVYSLTISYNNANNSVIRGDLQFFAADGTLMKKEPVEFTPTRAGKSNYITTNTGTMVNAGNYKVRLTSNAGGISINTLDVQ